MDRQTQWACVLAQKAWLVCIIYSSFPSTGTSLASSVRRPLSWEI
jgi:hypothetical protein